MTLLTAAEDVQIPLLSAMLLGGCFAKLVRMLRTRTVTAALGPTALFPLHLRRPAAIFLCAAEFGLGIGLIVTGPAWQGRASKRGQAHGGHLVRRRHLRLA